MKQISSRLTAIPVPSLTRFVFGTILLYTQSGKPAWRGDQARALKQGVASGEWLATIPSHFGCGRWAFLEATNPYDDVAALIRSTPQRADTSRAVGASP